MAAEFWFSDRQWQVIEPLLPRNQPGARRVDDRRVLSGIVHVLRSGGRACQGIWDELFLDGIPTNAFGTVMLDSSACKAQRYASGARGGGEEALGRSRGGLTTKIHAVVDDLGRPLCFLLTPGQAADCRLARALLEGCRSSA